MNTQEASTVQTFSQPPLNLRLEYDYSNFRSPALQTQAQEALQQFFTFVRHTFVSGLEIGRSFRQLLHQLCLEHGFAKGEQLFDRWLDSSDFGGSTWMARSLIQISEWFDSQKQRIQKLILNSVQSWSVSALKELTKIDDDHLLVKLLKAGKQTVASIRTARKSIALGQPVTEADWQLVAQTFDADKEAIATLKAEAKRLAHNDANPQVLTDYLIEAIQDLTEWDTSKLLAPKRSARPTQQTQAIAAFIANSAAPSEPLDNERLAWVERGLGLDEAASQEFRACVQNLAQAEAGNSSKVIPKHHHLQKALSMQKLAPVVPQPQQSDQIAELERQVKDLRAQLKEADKATALIHGLQAQRDRLERENQQLQTLIQQNAQKDLEIHLLQQQLEQFEVSRSDAVLAQLKEQNQQLLNQLERMQQRYNALASEMAASKQSLKYSDNSTLVAKVMALETELATQKQNSQQPTTPANNSQVETYKSLLVSMATAIPFSAIAAGDRALVVKPQHPATGEFVSVMTEPDSVNFVTIQTDAGATWHICAEDLRLESMLGDQGFDLISTTFAAAASKQRLPGWTEKGYRSPYGLFYRGWEAIAKFTQAMLEAETVSFTENPDWPSNLMRWMETVTATAQGQG